MRELYKGEKRAITVEVIRKTAEAFTLGECQYHIVSSSFQVLDSGTADIDVHKVSCIFDTTGSQFKEKQTYFVYFTITIEGLLKTLIHPVQVFLKRGY